MVCCLSATTRIKGLKTLIISIYLKKKGSALPSGVIQVKKIYHYILILAIGFEVRSDPFSESREFELNQFLTFELLPGPSTRSERQDQRKKVAECYVRQLNCTTHHPACDLFM